MRPLYVWIIDREIMGIGDTRAEALDSAQGHIEDVTRLFESQGVPIDPPDGRQGYGVKVRFSHYPVDQDPRAVIADALEPPDLDEAGLETEEADIIEQMIESVEDEEEDPEEYASEARSEHRERSPAGGLAPPITGGDEEEDIEGMLTALHTVEDDSGYETENSAQDQHENQDEQESLDEQESQDGEESLGEQEPENSNPEPQGFHHTHEEAEEQNVEPETDSRGR